MLILTRRIGESVVIGDDVYLTVLGVRGNQIRLGFDAPQEVTVHREEIHSKIKTEQSMFLKRTGNWAAGQSDRAH